MKKRPDAVGCSDSRLVLCWNRRQHRAGLKLASSRHSCEASKVPGIVDGRFLSRNMLFAIDVV